MESTEEATSPRDPSVVESDMVIMSRHLRNQIGIKWGRDDNDFLGVVTVGRREWNCELAYKEKYDFYVFRIQRTQNHSALIQRRFDVTNANAYGLTKDVMALVSTLRLIQSNSLDKDSEDQS